MKQLGDEERWAQACIQQALPESVVEQHDDGSRSGMYDLKIFYPDESIAAVEVSAAADGKQVELGKQLYDQGQGWRVPDLAGTWWVRVSPSAQVRTLRRELPGLLYALERNGVTVIRGRRSGTNGPAALASRLCIVEARQAQVPTEYAGRIFATIEKSPEQMGGYSPTTGDPVAVWLGEWLSEPSSADNLQKLARSGMRERHMFVLVPSSSSVSFAVMDLLASSDAPLPTAGADLPKSSLQPEAMTSVLRARRRKS
jgi:hypothetical protein